MNNTLLAASLLSALLHASWNAAVKAHAHPERAMTAQMVGAALLALPALAFTGPPEPAAWPWIAASTALNVIAVHTLLRAYAAGRFGVVYPLVRATQVLLVLPLAAVMAGEWPRPLAVGGVGLISGAVLLLAAGGRAGVPTAGWGWLALAAASGAGYVICDGLGVRASGSALAYGLVVTVTNAIGRLAMARGSGAPVRALLAHGRAGLVLAAVSTASYLLILWVYAHAPIAPASALRDTSALWAALIAVVVLKERPQVTVLAATLLAVAGCALIRLG